MTKETVVNVGIPNMVDQPTAEDKKVSQAQADQMYGKAAMHAPAQPTTLNDYPQGPAAQGPNLTKEEAEFFAASADNAKADDIPEEKRAAPVQESNKPIAPAGKEVKDKDVKDKEKK